MNNLTRREMLLMGVAGLALAALPLPALASLDEHIASFTGGATPGEGDLTLEAPEIAENGNAVPISVEAPGAKRIAIFAPENPDIFVCQWQFGPLSGRPFAATRIRLAGTQVITAVAEMEDGSYIAATAEVKVTIGGCGG